MTSPSSRSRRRCESRVRGSPRCRSSRPGPGISAPAHAWGRSSDPPRRTPSACLGGEAASRPPTCGRYLAITEDGAGGVRLRGRGTVEDAATIKAALLPLTKPTPASGATDEECGDGEDVRDHGARMWDAMVATCAHALATDLPPDAHGARPRVAVTLSLDALKGQIDWSPVTDDGTELSPGAVRRLACDADVIPVVLGTRSEVLDVGRAHRLVTPALWRALVCRDRHCAFPGCTRPPVMGHAHHIPHWADGGAHRAGQPGAALRAPPPHHPHHPVAGPAQPRRRRPEFLPPPKPGRHHPAPEWIRHRSRRE